MEDKGLKTKKIAGDTSFMPPAHIIVEISLAVLQRSMYAYR